MSFINTFFLYFLPLISIPLIYHWLNKRNFNTVEFSTLQFLSQLETDAIKKLKLKNWLLLFLRTLILFLLVMAFARPVIQVDKSGVKIGQGKELYLFLDNSASMNRTRDGKTLFEHQKQKILQQAEEQVYPINIKIITSTKPSQVSYEKMVKSKSGVENLINKIESTKLKGKILPGVKTIANSIKNSNEVSPAIWILSDFQETRSQFKTELARALKKISSARVVLFSENTNLDNYAIKKVSFPQQLLGVKQNISLRVQLTQTSGEKEVPLSLFKEKDRIGRTSVDFSENNTWVKDFQFSADQHGLLQGRIELSPDNYLSDNSYYFSINIPDKYRILVIGGKNQNNKYLVNAIEAGTKNRYSTELIAPSQFGSKNLNKYDILIISGGLELDFDLLNSFLKQDKGILIVSGSETKKAELNQLISKLGLPEWKTTTSLQQSNYIKLKEPNLKTPLLEGLWKGRNNLYGKYFKIPIFKTNVKKSKVAIEYENGYPFLMFRRDTINAALMATNLDLKWTDMVYTGFFPALVKRTLSYLGGQINFKYNYFIGDTVNIDKMDLAVNEVSIITPEDKEYYTEEIKGETVFKRTEEPGIYEVRSRNRRIMKFAVNISEQERNCQYLKINELKEIRNQVEELEVYHLSEQTSQKSSYELSHLLFALIIILAGAETWISNLK